MNFKKFYNQTENRLIDAILSLWATGDKDMQDYFKFLLSEEPIMAEPVFENTFPWEQDQSTFGQTTVFKEEFIDALDKIKDNEFRFPKNRKPYKHQLKSWRMLHNNKSIVVTTGTGSGKTECFMLPVLNDIYENCKNQEGINAIFLYPLNALIASQKKRMHAWCSALKGVKYALLTGNTSEKESYEEESKASPELISRNQIRNNPPQILFTNPTMLEYLLVRNADVPILDKSKGSLRWILLDEAHTLTGSKATEMALLIRRVVSAFQVTTKNLRFAITSATVGSNNEDILKKFMSDLCGISKDQIEIISGKRVKSQIEDDQISQISEVLSQDNIKLLREEFLKNKCIQLSQIDDYLNVSDRQDQLEILDKLSELKINDKNLLPIRGHFFTRGISGVYACTNKKCDKHKNRKANKPLGTMYTIAGKKCITCNHPLLELVACETCGNMMLEGKITKEDNGTQNISQKPSVGYEAFIVETDENDDEPQEITNNSVRLIHNNKNNNHSNKELIYCSISQNNELVSGDDFLYTTSSNCPHCNHKIKNTRHFRMSSALTNRVLSDIVLDQTEVMNEKQPSTLYEGRKYISFTDSRQGTAKVSALINKDTERDWIRYQVYHFLLERLKKKQPSFNKSDLIMERDFKIKILNTAPPLIKQKLKDEIKEIDNILSAGSNENLSNSRSSWSEIINKIKGTCDFKTLFNKIVKVNYVPNGRENYARSLLYDQFARRLRREKSLENLGLVSIVYPCLDNIKAPKIAGKLGIEKKEWLALLKIAIDYIIRYNYHFSFDDDLRLLTNKKYYPKLIYPSNTEVNTIHKWKLYNPKSINQSRFVLLICAGLGWHNQEDVTEIKEDQLNELLEDIWKTLRKDILTSDNDGYKLDFFEKTKFEISGEVFLCPATNGLVDKIFRGYSPRIKGNLEPNNIRNYKIDCTKNYRFPMYPYPYHLDENKPLSEEWITQARKKAMKKGLWNNLHERIFDKKKFYLAGEHSAQQNKKRREELENQFENGEINILSCSTTMEMGVDIGGISAVVMSNVPPKPTNYLQRTGRSGRRSESKSLALTYCASSPIGMRTMQNPTWALVHKIADPILAFDSKNIVERHVNSLLFGIFIRRPENNKRGLNVKMEIKDFFFDDSTPVAESFLKWLETLATSIRNESNYIAKE